MKLVFLDFDDERLFKLFFLRQRIQLFVIIIGDYKKVNYKKQVFKTNYRPVLEKQK